MNDENNIFRELAEGMKQGVRMLNAFLAALQAMESPQTIRTDISAVGEILKSLGTTSERIQRLLHNDGTYMSQFEATQLFREIATELTEAVKSALVMTDLSPEMQTEIRHNIVDEMLRRVTTAMEQQTAWRLSRRQQGFRATEQLTHDPLTHEEQQ